MQKLNIFCYYKVIIKWLLFIKGSPNTHKIIIFATTFFTTAFLNCGTSVLAVSSNEQNDKMWKTYVMCLWQLCDCLCIVILLLLSMYGDKGEIHLCTVSKKNFILWVHQDQSVIINVTREWIWGSVSWHRSAEITPQTWELVSLSCLWGRTAGKHKLKLRVFHQSGHTLLIDCVTDLENSKLFRTGLESTRSHHKHKKANIKPCKQSLSL